MNRRLKVILSAISGACLAALSGCSGGEAPTTIAPSDTTCAVNQAIIGVGDGFLENLCGCGGSQGQITKPPATFTCTIHAGGAVVFFQYIGTRTAHQIASSLGSALTFTPSPLSDPNAQTPIRMHAVQLTASGTYGFTDLFDSSLQGQIVVP